MKHKHFFLLFLLVIGIFMTASPARALNFNPSYIISDDEILDSSSMSAADVQRFLEGRGSYLANYICADAAGIMRKASEIIYNAAANNYDCDDVIGLSDNPTDKEKAAKCKKISINPRFLLVLLQKEQSLVDDSSPRQSQLDWAAGYGCPDGSACGTRWKGFGKQVNSAALQFYDYMSHPQYYTYKAGGYYNFTNPYSTTYKGSVAVTPVNQATAALYNYTPHVYNGNYNFFNIWQRWFTRNYADGSLLQVKGEPGVYLIQNGKKRPFLSRGALTSRFDLNKILQVNASDLDKFELGAPIKFPQYSLIRSPMNNIYLLVDDKKHLISGKDTFRQIGFNPDEVEDGTVEELNAYADGKAITATSTYPFGALVQDKLGGGVYWLSEGVKYPLYDRVFLATKFKGKRIVKLSTKELDYYPKGEPVKFSDGELLKGETSPAVYLIANGQKKSFVSGDIFEGLGYKWSNVVTVPNRILSLFPDGEPILKINSDTQLALTPTSTEAIIETSTDPLATSTGDQAAATTSTTTLSQEATYISSSN